MENCVLSVDPSKVKTAFIGRPLIYGIGERLGNKFVIQAPNIAQKILADGKGFRLGRGLNARSNIHVRDVGDLFDKLAEAAINRSPQEYNEDRIYLPTNASMVTAFTTTYKWGVIFTEYDVIDVLRTLWAQKSGGHAQTPLKSAARKHAIAVDETNQAMLAGAMVLGANAVFASNKSRGILGC